MAWQTRASRVVYENRWIRVREDQVVGPAGEGIYGVVDMQHPAVFVVALDAEDRIALVSLDRYATGGMSLEVPAGGTDGEDPLLAAQRELREETGFVADEWTSLGRMNALNGIANAPEYVFLARGLHAVDSGDGRDEEGIDEVRWVGFGEALGLIAAGGILDGESIGSIALAGIHLGRFR